LVITGRPSTVACTITALRPWRAIASRTSASIRLRMLAAEAASARPAPSVARPATTTTSAATVVQQRMALVPPVMVGPSWSDRV
jgi:hypothetical protein